jgi:hypothetical protein
VMVSAESAVIKEPSSSARGHRRQALGETAFRQKMSRLRAAAFSHLPSSVLFQIVKYPSVMICHELRHFDQIIRPEQCETDRQRKVTRIPHFRLRRKPTSVRFRPTPKVRSSNAKDLKRTSSIKAFWEIIHRARFVERPVSLQATPVEVCDRLGWTADIYRKRRGRHGRQR